MAISMLLLLIQSLDVCRLYLLSEMTSLLRRVILLKILILF